jgi:predicted transcriptional regulator of viral defense system
MVTKYISLLLIVLLNVPTFSKWSVVIYYQVNKSSIAKELCINRNRPQLHCDGKCFLAKKLKAADEREQKSTSDKLEKMQEITLFFQKIEAGLTGESRVFRNLIAINYFYIEPFLSARALSIFHPPQF